MIGLIVKGFAHLRNALSRAVKSIVDLDIDYAPRRPFGYGCWWDQPIWDSDIQYPVAWKRKRYNDVDSLVKSAVEYAESALDLAEDFLAQWYLSEQTNLATTAWQKPGDYEKALSELSRKYQENRSRLERIAQK